MSGPKVSNYQLTAKERKNMTQQIRCEQNTIACLEQVNLHLKDIMAIRPKLQSIKKKILMLSEETGLGMDTLKRLEEFEIQLENTCEASREKARAYFIKPSAKIILSEEALAEKQLHLRLAETLLSEIKEALLNGSQFYEEASEQSDKNSAMLHDKILSGFDGAVTESFAGFSGDFSCGETCEASDTSALSERKQSIEKMISEIADMEGLPPEFKSEISDARKTLNNIISMEFLKNFASISLSALKKKAHRLIEERKSDRAQLNDIYALSDLESAIFKQREQEYISDCIDSVMAEMGYDVIGDREVTKRSGKRFKSRLFTYSDGTALNVTHSDDGQIAMELGGIDHIDRLPTDEEAKILCEDMEDFCTDFSEIEKRLLGKGIVAKSRIAISPPSAEFASIINISDYNTGDVSNVSVFTAKNKRRRSEAIKTLRKGDINGA